MEEKAEKDMTVVKMEPINDPDDAEELQEADLLESPSEQIESTVGKREIKLVHVDRSSNEESTDWTRQPALCSDVAKQDEDDKGTLSVMNVTPDGVLDGTVKVENFETDDNMDHEVPDMSDLVEACLNECEESKMSVSIKEQCTEDVDQQSVSFARNERYVLDCTNSEAVKILCGDSPVLEVKTAANAQSSFVDASAAAQKPLKCKYCSEVFHHHASLELHERYHVPSAPLSDKQAADANVQRLSEKLLLKLRKFTVYKGLDVENKPYKCLHCPETFSRITYLKEHEKVHLSSEIQKVLFECRYCSKNFATRNSLKVHQRCHMEEHPYKCLQCLQTFPRRQDLRAHETVHADESSFQCFYCKETFLDMTSLQVHEKDHVRKNVSEDSFQHFSSASPGAKAKGRERKHSEETTYVCTLCGQRFSKLLHVQAHKKVHQMEGSCAGEKKSVSFCCESFSQVRNLRICERVHT